MKILVRLFAFCILVWSSDAFAEEGPSQDEPSAQLDAILDAQPDEVKARYQYRHPKETLTFFGIEPGMTVVDTLPGSVWYSGILGKYLGQDGTVIGANYSVDMLKAFGNRMSSEEALAARAAWVNTWPQEMSAQLDEPHAQFKAFLYGSLPEELQGTADVVLMMRAAHHFNRLEDEGGFFTTALKDAATVLKPGGILGIVQHRAPEENSDAWADGTHGYLKQSHVVAFVEAAGFELVETSEINANPNDQPTESDIVWRLPPALRPRVDDDQMEAAKAAMREIGESDRMTLKFRKKDG